MNTYYLDEVIERLIEMRKDGYRYFQVVELEEDIEDNRPACLCFSAEECGGLGACDYESVNCVSDEEVKAYAERYKDAPKHRICIEFETE